MLKPGHAREPNGWGAWAYRLLPLFSRARARLGARATLASTATRSWVLSPATTTVNAAAIYDPDDLTRITGAAPDTYGTLARQLQRIAPGPREHQATVAYELDDVVLARGHFFAHGLVLRVAVTPVPVIAPVITEEHDHAVLANTHYGLRYFGHWLSDDLSLTLAAQDVGKPVSLLLRPSEHQSSYLSALQLQVPVIESARFRKLVVVDDIGQNAYKAQRYERLRDQLRRHVPVGLKKPLLLLRGEAGTRRVLANESDIADALVARGFDVLDPLSVSFERLVSACMDTELIIGVEGSHLAHGLMWMKPGGTLLVIQPPQRFSAYYKERCDCEGMRFAFIVGRPTQQEGDFTIDVSQLLRLLDRLGCA